VTGYLVDFIDACELLRRSHIAVVNGAYVSSPEDAVAFYRGEIGQYSPQPLTLKVISPKVPEKSAKGFVLVGLRGEDEVRSGFRRLAEAAKPFEPFRILAQPTVRGRNMALAVGCHEQPPGKKWLFLGLLPRGGQTISESVERPIPVSADAAAEMVAHLHSAHALAPRRRDLAMLKHFLVNISQAVEENGVTSLLLSPVILHENQYTAVDVKMYADRAKLPALAQARKHPRTEKSPGSRSIMSVERREAALRMKSPSPRMQRRAQR
jgi:hypothetical protein